MINRISSFTLAAILVAAPLSAFANDGQNDSGNDRGHEDRGMFRAELGGGFFGGFGGNKDHEKKEDNGKHLGNFRLDVNTEARIEARIDNLQVLIDRIEASDRLSTEKKDRMIAGIEAQIALLEDLQARIDAGESRADIKTDLKLALKGKVHAMPKAAVDAAADRVLSIADRVEGLADRLEARIDDARDDGDNVDVSVEAHADLVAHLGDARAEANAALDLIADLSLDADDDAAIAENRRILEAARENIDDAYQALKAAREDVRTILVDLDIEAKAVVE